MLTDDKWDIRAFLHKVEAVEGEDEEPTPAADAIVLHEGTVQVEQDSITLNRDQPDGGGRQQIFHSRRGVLGGTIELVGAATAGDAAPIGRILRTGGHDEVLVDETGPPVIKAADYLPRLRGFPSGTSYFFHDGELFKLVGVRGALTAINLSINDFPQATYTSMGEVLLIDEEGVPSAVDVSAFEIPEVGTKGNMTVTIDGNVIDAISLEVSGNIDLGMKYSTEATRSRHAARSWSGNLQIFRPEIADADIRAMVRSHALVPVLVDYEHAEDEARHLSLLAPNAQLGEPELVNVNGDKAWNLPITFVRAGEPDYRLRFGGEVVA